MSPHRIVAFGGGHGLSATLRALTTLSSTITAVVTVADDGGSSGRLRDEFDYLPPGDLRQALVALASTDDVHDRTAALLQHRFRGQGPLSSHAIGNLLLAGAFDVFGDPVVALEHVGALLGARGRVLPMSTVPLAIEADVSGLDPNDPSAMTIVRGQAHVATTKGTVNRVRISPPTPPACDQAVAAVEEADWLIFGPGSWFTSVLPHFLVPDLADAIHRSAAQRLVILNLAADGETSGWTIEEHLAAITRHEPRFRADVVLADPRTAAHDGGLRQAANAVGARLRTGAVADTSGVPRHSSVLLGKQLSSIIG